MSPLAEAAWWALALAGLAGSWLCSGMEIGLYCVNRIRLRTRAAGHDVNARLLARELAEPERVLAALLIGNNVFQFMIATGATALLAERGYSDTAIIAIDAAILTPALLVFCEALPKELFRVRADSITYAAAGVVAALRILLTIVPVLPLVRAVTGAVGRWLGDDPSLALGSRERVVAMIKEGTSRGLLSETQATLIDRALVFQETTVGEEMVLWGQVRAVGADWDRERVLGLIGREPFSALPVVDRGGRVVGGLRSIDALTRADVPVAELAVGVARFSVRTPVRDALRQLRRAESGLGIVERDGKPIGLVTARDLVEPLTGELPRW